MKQYEIEFFWPLTEQIELDLDYSNCSKTENKKVFLETGTLVKTSLEPTYVTTSFTIDPDMVSLGLKKKPNIIAQILYKLLNVKWRIV